MVYSSIDDGDDCEHNAVDLIDISEIFTTQSAVFFKQAPFDEVQCLLNTDM